LFQVSNVHENATSSDGTQNTSYSFHSDIVRPYEVNDHSEVLISKLYLFHPLTYLSILNSVLNREQ